jgi:hypothetical protein
MLRDFFVRDHLGRGGILARTSCGLLLLQALLARNLT